MHFLKRVLPIKAKSALRRRINNLQFLNSSEAQAIVKIDLELNSRIESELPNRTEKKLILFCMTRDENELLTYWLRHHSSISGVAAIVIVDHKSAIPVTLNRLEYNPAIEYLLYKYSNEAYLQAHVLNAITLEMSRAWKNSIFLPLDTDEFLTNQLARGILDSRQPSGHLLWRTVWPSALFENPTGHSNPPSLLTSTLPPEFVFVANSDFGGTKHFLSSKLRRRGFRWSQGAHVIYNKFGFPINSTCLGSIIHLPIQSFAQLVRKFGLGDQVHSIPLLSRTGADGSRIAAEHWSLPDSEISDSETFVRESLGKYIEGDLSDSELSLWSSLINNMEDEEL